jgi:hypothetical protein
LIWGEAYHYYISTGRGSSYFGFTNGSGAFFLDAGKKIANPPDNLSFSARLTFLDPTSLVEVYGGRKVYSDALTESFSWTASSAFASATLRTGSQNEDVANFEFYPVIKVPFTNT